MAVKSVSMTDSLELVPVDLTEDERGFIEQALAQWGWSASDAPFPFQLLGLSTWEEFGGLIVRLQRAVAEGEPLTDLDWARVLFLTEITWASSLIGAGLDFAIVTRFSDIDGLSVLRGLQRKLGGYTLGRLLFPHAGRTPAGAGIDAQQRLAERLRLRREQQARRSRRRL